MHIRAYWARIIKLARRPRGLMSSLSGSSRLCGFSSFLGFLGFSSFPSSLLCCLLFSSSYLFSFFFPLIVFIELFCLICRFYSSSFSSSSCFIFFPCRLSGAHPPLLAFTSRSRSLYCILPAWLIGMQQLRRSSRFFNLSPGVERDWSRGPPECASGPRDQLLA